MKPGKGRDSNDEGETLIELVMAMMIMGIAVVAIVGGIATTILMSDVHRKQASAGAYVRDYAEAVSGHYDGSITPSYLPAAVSFTVPAGFTATMTSLKCWDDALKVFNTCTTANDVQQVTLKMTSTDNRASESLAVVVRQP